jgi:uncharacterized protein YqhQ
MSFDRESPAKGCSPSSGGSLRRKEEPLRVGGQAVIEGVMMRSPRSMAVAVRKPTGEIVVKQENLTFFSEGTFLFKIPLVRGILALLSALVLGIRALNFSANHAMSDAGKGKEPGAWTMGLTIFVALCFGMFLFFLVPLFLTRWLRFVMPLLSESGLFFNLVDGVLRMAIFLAYLWTISRIGEIRRVFEYHGAEHKSIFAFESGEELRVDRVKGFPILHPRCGTSFLLIVMVVSILAFALVPHQVSFGYKVASRFVFVPLIAGLSYEIIRFADRRRESRGARYFIQPGLWLQRLTAREPSEDQIEVAIRALQTVLQCEHQREGVGDV